MQMNGCYGKATLNSSPIDNEWREGKWYLLSLTMYFFVHYLRLLLPELNKIGTVIFSLIMKKLRIKKFKLPKLMS